MITLSLNEKEVDLIKKAIKHCLDTCKKGGSQNDCTDCTALENVLHKIP